jgi:hypothetical protein
MKNEKIIEKLLAFKEENHFYFQYEEEGKNYAISKKLLSLKI